MKIVRFKQVGLNDRGEVVEARGLVETNWMVYCEADTKEQQHMREYKVRGEG